MRKRLRVGLRARDPDELALAMGPFLSADGAFLLTNERLAPGTPVVLQLFYADERMALEGEGEVLQARSAPSGLILALNWTPLSRPLLDQILATPAAASDEPIAPEPDEDLWNEQSTVFFEDETPIPGPPPPLAPPPPPPRPTSAPLKVIVGARVMTNDLVSDLMPPAPPTSDLAELVFGDDVRRRLRAGSSTEYAYSSDEVEHDAVDEASAGETSGEVTALARIELVRHYSPTVRTGDFAAPQLDGIHSTLPLPSKKQRTALGDRTGPTVAVDLGSTWVRMAALRGPAAPERLAFRNGAEALPAAVSVGTDGKTLVGERAVARLHQAPHEGAIMIKRLLAAPFASPSLVPRAKYLAAKVVAAEETEVAVEIGPHRVSFEELAALLLKEAALGASATLGVTSNRVLLTCPGHYGQRQRVGLITAGLLAGLHVEAVVSAPLAAVYQQVVLGLADGRYLVVDLGGGITDLAVVQVQEGMVVAVATGGDLALGGIDFDAALAAKLDPRKDRGVGAGERLWVAERAKRALSEQEAVAWTLPGTGAGPGPSGTIDRPSARAAWAPLLERLEALISEVLIRAGTQATGLSGYFLLGGQGESPILQEALHRWLGQAPLPVSAEDQTVLGAARLAGIRDQEEALPVVELLASTLGLGLFGGDVAPIIARDHPLPIAGRYLHRVEQDRDLDLYLFQGDQRRVERDEPLARLRLVEGAHSPRRPYSVIIALEVDPNGPISARAFDAATKGELSLVDVPDITRSGLDRHHELAVEDSGIFSRLVKRFRGQPNAE